MSTFAETGLSAELLKGIEKLGFVEPTPVQAKVIPLLIKGKRDVVALAQTGTGKTAAFGLPLLQLTDPAKKHVQALVLCPTRELCLQITKDLESFGRFAPHLRTLAVYGGSSIQTQVRALHQGVHILVATPGRLNDLLRRGAAKLEGVQRVVLDEADEMLNMGFQEDLELILAEVPDEARTLLFSATMPRQVANIASKYMDDPEEIIVSSKNAGANKIEHQCYVVHARDRYAALKRILDSTPGFYGIVFCRTRLETQEVSSHLTADGYLADALHGDISQDNRDRVMRHFRNRGLQILVATDVAARGLDVNDLTHVVHFDLPSDPDVYTHRSGRTGRAGKSGISMILAHMREEYKVRAIERITKKPFEFKRVPTGREVCEARLRAFLETVKQPAEGVAKLKEFRPAIEECFKDMSREEILDLFVAREFGQTVENYLNAPDLNARGAAPRAERPPRPAPHAEGGGYPDRPPRQAGPREDRHPADDRHADALTTLRVNLGKRNGLTPAALITLINRATPGPMLPLGRIRILDTDAVFEVPEGAVDFLLPNLNRAIFQDRPVRAVLDAVDSSAHGDSHRPYR